MEGNDPGLIKAKLSQEFEIRLRSIPSSGYIWQVEACHESLSLIDVIYEQIAPQTVGGNVDQIFRFRASAKGSYVVTFVLKRTWEPSALESRRFIVEVN